MDLFFGVLRKCFP